MQRLYVDIHIVNYAGWLHPHENHVRRFNHIIMCRDVARNV